MMDKVSETLYVFFEEPFWVGVFERKMEGKLSVCKITFGTEPKDYDIYRYILSQYHELQFSPAVAAEAEKMKKNPKRVQREIHRQVQCQGIGTKSQQALKLQQEQRKTKQKQFRKVQKKADRQRQFELKQQKRKEKHRGR